MAEIETFLTTILQAHCDERWPHDPHVGTVKLEPRAFTDVWAIKVTDAAGSSITRYVHRDKTALPSEDVRMIADNFAIIAPQPFTPTGNPA